MHDDDLLGVQQMHDLALVRSARRQMDAALAELAVRPLDSAAAAQMRAVLSARGSVRAALRRLRAASPDGEPPPGGARLACVAPHVLPALPWDAA